MKRTCLSAYIFMHFVSETTTHFCKIWYCWTVLNVETKIQFCYVSVQYNLLLYVKLKVFVNFIKNYSLYMLNSKVRKR
jgi:hypothetical protein